MHAAAPVYLRDGSQRPKDLRVVEVVEVVEVVNMLKSIPD